MTSSSIINIVSWNTNSLNGHVKRAACLDYLCRHHVDVAFMQESLIKNSDIHRFANKFYYTAASESVDSKTQSSLVVLKRNLSLTLLETYGSTDGAYLM